MEFRLRWQFTRTLYRIRVADPERRNRGVARALLDGVTLDPRGIPLIDDGAEHRLEVTMGEPAPEVRDRSVEGPRRLV